MNVSFGSRRGESRLGGLIILAVVGVLAYGLVRFAVSGRNEDRPVAGANGKTQQQLKNERINQILDAEAPDLGPDPSRALVDGNLKTLKAVRDQVADQQAVIRSRLANANDSLTRLNREILDLERKWKAAKAKLRSSPNDEKAAIEFGECDENLEKKYSERLQAQADVKVLKDYEHGIAREKEVLSASIRRCEAEGRIIATATEFEELKKNLSKAHGAVSGINEMRRNVDGKNTDVAVRVSGEKARLRERAAKSLEKAPWRPE